VFVLGSFPSDQYEVDKQCGSDMGTASWVTGLRAVRSGEGYTATLYMEGME